MRLTVFKAFVFGALLLLAGRLFYVQVLCGAYYRAVAERNRIRVVPLAAPRGQIVDRNGKALAANVPLWELQVVREDLAEGDRAVVSRLLHEEEASVKNRLAEKTPLFQPVVVKRELSFEEVVRFEEHSLELPAARVVTRAVRSYPYGADLAHVVGYLGKVSREEYGRDRGERYLYDDMIGRDGVEAVMDERLRGTFGGRQVEANARGRPLRVLSEKEPKPGESVALTIDADLQKGIGGLLGERKGVVAVLDLATDGVLALASHPSYDPNVFVRPQGSGERAGLLKDARAPLLNRSVASSYPPGSVFKLVTALTALEKGVITPHTTFTCAGSFRLGGRGRPFKCWKEWGHGPVDLTGAIEKSCNVYFYNVASRLSADDLATWSHRLGFGETCSLELPRLSRGLVPSPLWKQTAIHEKWYQGETLSFAIGQSYLLVTPLQILRLGGFFATRGSLPDPHLVRDAPVRRSVVAVRPETLGAIRKGMERVVEGAEGTGKPARVQGLPIAAKTGTAQAPTRDPHAWFVGYAPMDRPQVAVVVFVEHGGSGGAVAGSVAKSVFEMWRDSRAPTVLA